MTRKKTQQDEPEGTAEVEPFAAVTRALQERAERVASKVDPERVRWAYAYAGVPMPQGTPPAREMTDTEKAMHAAMFGSDPQADTTTNTTTQHRKGKQ